MACVTMLYFILIYSQTGKSNYVNIDWSQTQQMGSYSERIIPNQGNIHYGSCPCDISSQMCDISCCCDHECTDLDKTAFECLKGFKGGESTTRHADIYCTFHGPYSSEWHGFLCLEYDNNPYLGHFFSFFPVIKTIEMYISKINSPKYSYEETEAETQTLSTHSHYFIGSEIEITNDDNKLLKGYLSLPQSSIHAYCIDSYPILFLKEKTHICPLVLTPVSCINNKKLNSNYYLHSSSKIPSFFNHHLKSNLSDSQFANVTVQYLCQNNIESYIKIQGLNRLSLKEKSDFYSSINYASIVNCNGSRSPVYNETHNFCENVVIDVQYIIYWSGSSIEGILAKIIIGNIPISLVNTEYKNKIRTKVNTSMKNKLEQDRKRSLKITLLQNFKVSFNHVGSTYKSIENITIELDTEDITEDNVYINESKPIINLLQRSGGPGYIINKPLLAGYIQYINSTQNTTVINESTYIFEYNEKLNNISTREENEINMTFFNNSSILLELYNESVENNNFSMEQKEAISLYNYSDVNTTLYSEITENKTEKKFHYVDIPYDSGLFIIKPVSDGECRSSSLEPVRFGIDSISGCKFYFQLQDYDSCRKIRDDVTEFLMSFVQADTMSKKGWPNATMEQDFIPILIENKYDKIQRPNGCELPTSLEYTFIYQDVAYRTAHSNLPAPIYQIKAASVRIFHSWYHLGKQSPSHVQMTISSTFIENSRPSQISRFWLSQHDPWCSGGICWKEIFHPWIQTASSHHKVNTLDSLTWHSRSYSQEVSSLRIHHFLQNSTHFIQLFSNSIVIILLVIPLLVLTLNQHYRIKL